MTPCYNLWHDWWSIKCANAPTHTHTHTSSMICHPILRQEKDHQKERYDLSTSIHFKSGVIWVSKQRFPFHAPHPQPQVESWQIISHAATVLLQSGTNTVISRPLANLFAVCLEVSFICCDALLGLLNAGGCCLRSRSQRERLQGRNWVYSI